MTYNISAIPDFDVIGPAFNNTTSKTGKQQGNRTCRQQKNGTQKHDNLILKFKQQTCKTTKACEGWVLQCCSVYSCIVSYFSEYNLCSDCLWSLPIDLTLQTVMYSRLDKNGHKVVRDIAPCIELCDTLQMKSLHMWTLEIGRINTSVRQVYQFH